MEVAVNAKSAANAYLQAANQEPSSESLGAAIQGVNGESGSGCIRDYSQAGAPCKALSFLKTPAGLAFRPFLSRTAGESDQDGDTAVRKTQAPMVWFHFHA